MRFGGHAVDALLFECHAGYEAVITQFGKEPVVIPAAVSKAAAVVVEGDKRYRHHIDVAGVDGPQRRESRIA